MSTKPTEDMNYIERVEYYREEVHEELTDTYDDLLGEGCAPPHAAGVLRYVAGALGHESRVRQSDAAEEYGMSGVTLRNWLGTAWEHQTGEEWTGRPVTGTTETTGRTSPTTTRQVFYELYYADQPLLTLRELKDRIDRSMDTIAQALRTLEDTGAVGGRVKRGTHGGVKEWGAVPRPDTPEFAHESARLADEFDLTLSELIEEIAEIRGWEAGDRSYRSDGEYLPGTSGYRGRSANIRESGWADLTGETDQLSRLHVLIDDYGLDPETDISISISPNRNGLAKLYQTLQETDE